MAYLLILPTSLYIALGDQGIEQFDISDPSKPQRLRHIGHSARALAPHKDGLVFYSMIDQELVIGSLDDAVVASDSSINNSTEIKRQLEEIPTLIKVINKQIFLMTTSITESFINIIDLETLTSLERFSLQRDYGQFATAMINDIFFADGLLHLIVSPPLPLVHVLDLSAEDFQLINKRDFETFSLLRKDNKIVTRLEGVMSLYENLESVPELCIDTFLQSCLEAPDTRLAEVVMPETVKLIYYEQTFGTLANNPAQAVMQLIEASGYLQRFQLSQDTKYSFFASEAYGFSVIKH